MVADMLTKPLGGSNLKKLSDLAFIVDIGNIGSRFLKKIDFIL
jgi:hypothetical protein